MTVISQAVRGLPDAKGMLEKAVRVFVESLRVLIEAASPLDVLIEATESAYWCVGLYKVAVIVKRQ